MKRLVHTLLAALALVAGLVGSASGTSAATTRSVQKPITHLHRGPVLHGPHGSVHGDSTTAIWSGYAAYGTVFNSASGTWTVPHVNCSWGATGASSTWVGLDGYGNPTVEQLGTSQNCFWGGENYHAWYELYPQAEVALPSNDPVYPGDVMHAWVQYQNTSDSYWFHLQNSTRGWTWNLTVHTPSPRPTNTTAEWITEQYSCFYTCSWLANFGSVTFTDATASRPSSAAQPISAFPNDRITMTDGSTVKAWATALSPSAYGSRFTIYYAHS
jgi:hypothetical protein